MEIIVGFMKFKKKIFSNLLIQQKGFTLINVMVSTAILSIIGLGFASLITSQLKEQKSVRTSMGRDWLVSGYVEPLFHKRPF